MFSAKTEKIKTLIQIYQKYKIISQLDSLFFGNVNVYIDYANIKPWAETLRWHIDLKRLKQFLSSFDNIKKTSLYAGTLVGDGDSEHFIKYVVKYGYDARTKPVKIMKFSIDASSISIDSIDLIKQFVKKALLRKYDVATIKFLNQKFNDMNSLGQFYIEDRKCNFDVEIGRDMLIDHERNSVDTFILWSGDSDFAEPLASLLASGKKVILFATARRVSTELNELRNNGLFVFDIQKIKEFICWKRDL